MTRLALLVGLALSGLVGCHSSAPRYPAYYETWSQMSPELRGSLDSHRRDAESKTSADRVLAYARISARLASVQGDHWLEVAADPEPVFASRHTRARRRLHESTEHTLALFSEARLRGERWSVTDHLTLAWLLTVGGRDDEAREILGSALGDPTLDDESHETIRELLEQIETLPPERHDP